MSCNASFPATIPFDCVKEVLYDFKSGAVTAKTFTKIAFGVGCLLSMAGGGAPIFAQSAPDPADFPPDATLGEFSNDAEAICQTIEMTMTHVEKGLGELQMTGPLGDEAGNQANYVQGPGLLTILSMVRLLFQLGLIGSKGN